MSLMQDDYSWNGGNRGASSFRLPENEGQGRWVLIALCMAVLLHVLVFFWLGKIDVFLPQMEEESELVTKVVRVNPVDINDNRPEIVAPDSTEAEEPVDVVPPANELEALENLPEMDMDISPEIDDLQIPEVKSALAGELDSEMEEPMKAVNFEPDMAEMGKTEDFLPRANDSQVTVDPGARMAEQFDPDEFTDKMLKGAGGESEDGLLKNFTSLEKMVNMDGNALLKSKALIGSDLLFEFNSSELRQSARVSLMKVAMLIHKHPKLVCWVDGHTDLIGGEESNMKLSRERAMAVKRWLIDSMEIKDDRIAVRGFGKQAPIVMSGTQEQQAPNRRVEIKMRKSQPEDVTPKKELAQEPILIKPKLSPEEASKAILVEEDELVAPRAIVEPEEEASIRRAVVVPEDEE